MIKGTVSVDPRGYPLLYVGNALGRPRAGYHVFSLVDFRELAFLPGSDRRAPRGWPAFDSNGVVVDDRLIEPGENGLFYTVRLNTHWDPETGEIGLRPQVSTAVLSSVGCESSASVWQNSAYCSDNSGHLFRIDLDKPTKAHMLRALGDDADPSPTFDEDGCFYTGIEVDVRPTAGAKGESCTSARPRWRARLEVGVSASTFHGSSKIHDINGGLLSTPALWPAGNLVFVNTAHSPHMNQGSLGRAGWPDGQASLVDQDSQLRVELPVVVDGTVLAADASGALYVRDGATGRTLLTRLSGEPSPCTLTCTRRSSRRR